MEKLEEDKKKGISSVGGGGSRGGSHASTPAAAQGKGKRQLGLAGATASHHGRRVHIWASSFGSEEQHGPPPPSPLTPAPPLRGKETSRQRSGGALLPGDRQKESKVAGDFWQGGNAGRRRSQVRGPRLQRGLPRPGAGCEGQGQGVQRGPSREPCARSLPTCVGREGAGSGGLRRGCPRPHMSVAREAWRLAPAPAGPVR